VAPNSHPAQTSQKNKDKKFISILRKSKQPRLLGGGFRLCNAREATTRAHARRKPSSAN